MALLAMLRSAKFSRPSPWGIECVRHLTVAPASKETIWQAVSGSLEAHGKGVIPAVKPGREQPSVSVTPAFIAAVTIPCMSLIA
jgi:hypothetical protein